MARKWIHRVVLAGVLALPVSCGATSREFRTQVHNGAGQVVRAKLVLDPPLADDVTLDTIDLRPGESGGLGPVRVTKSGRVKLSVTRPGEVGIPPVEERLSAGQSSFDVDDSANFGVSGISINPSRGRDR